MKYVRNHLLLCLSRVVTVKQDDEGRGDYTEEEGECGGNGHSMGMTRNINDGDSMPGGDRTELM